MSKENWTHFDTGWTASVQPVEELRYHFLESGRAFHHIVRNAVYLCGACWDWDFWIDQGREGVNLLARTAKLDAG
jgi:hypothetical protein